MSLIGGQDFSCNSRGKNLPSPLWSILSVEIHAGHLSSKPPPRGRKGYQLKSEAGKTEYGRTGCSRIDAVFRCMPSLDDPPIYISHSEVKSIHSTLQNMTITSTDKGKVKIRTMSLHYLTSILDSEPNLSVSFKDSVKMPLLKKLSSQGTSSLAFFLEEQLPFFWYCGSLDDWPTTLNQKIANKLLLNTLVLDEVTIKDMN